MSPKRALHSPPSGRPPNAPAFRLLRRDSREAGPLLARGSRAAHPHDPAGSGPPHAPRRAADVVPTVPQGADGRGARRLPAQPQRVRENIMEFSSFLREPNTSLVERENMRLNTVGEMLGEAYRAAMAWAIRDETAETYATLGLDSTGTRIVEPDAA